MRIDSARWLATAPTNPQGYGTPKILTFSSRWFRLLKLCIFTLRWARTLHRRTNWACLQFLRPKVV